MLFRDDRQVMFYTLARRIYIVGQCDGPLCSFAMAVRCQERSLSEDIVNSSNNKETIAIEEIVRAGPRGAIALAGTSTAIVIGLWFLFYFLVFLPRGVIQ